jgi:hypothetical protein
MEIKSFNKYPKKKLIKLCVEYDLVTWEDGFKKSREELLKLLADK